MDAINLLDQFLIQDATLHVRKVLLDSIAAVQSGKKHLQEFTFNRFNVRIDAATGRVTLEDELNTSEGGKIEVGISEFAAHLRKDSKAGG